MPGITGCVSWAGGGPGEIPQKMADALGLGPQIHQIASERAGKVGMAHAALGKGPFPAGVARDESGRVLAAVDGEFLGSPGGGGGEAARIALARYLEEGIDFVRSLKGFFSLAIWDGREERLHLVSDRRGLRPLYWWKGEDSLLFASEIKGLLAGGAPAVRDPRGLADFLVFGFPLGTRTLLEGVRCLPPGAILTFGPEGRKEEKVWHRLFYSWDRGNRRKVREWADRLEGAFRAAGPAMVGKKTAVPLSGGMDSRVAAALVHAQGKKAFACTIGSEGSKDLTLGRETARRLGWDHEAVLLQPADLPERARLGVYLADGTFPVLDTHILHVAWALPEDVDVALDGVGSFEGLYSCYDVLARDWGVGKNPPWKQVARVFTQPLLGEGGSLTQEELFQEEILPLLRDGAAASFEELLGGIPEGMEDPFDRSDFLQQTHRVRRYNILGAVLMRNYVEVRHPFFAWEVLDSAEEMPPLFRAREKLVTGLIPGRLAPPLKGLEYERTGWRAGAGPLELLLPMGIRAFRKAGRRFFPGLFPARGMAVDYGGWLAREKEVQEFFRDLVAGERALSRGIFRPQAVRALVEGAVASPGKDLKLLNRLAALELWHRYFLDGDSPPPDPSGDA